MENRQSDGPRTDGPSSDGPRLDGPRSDDERTTIISRRVEAIFRAAQSAPDSAAQSAILDRECAQAPEIRQRVEALLDNQRASARTVKQPLVARAEPPTRVQEGTIIVGGERDHEHSAGADTEQGPPLVMKEDVTKEDEGQIVLDFLQPSPMQGSLGRLGHYEVLEVLGVGGFGVVVRAFDEKLQRMVAIKVMSSQLASTSPARKRFVREARAAARIRHENVVQIYAVEEQPVPYLVMEYIPGQTLQQKLDQSGPLELPDVLRIGGQIARGLAAAHDQGLIHRDIKPGNILLEGALEQKVKITDFGLARSADDASLTQSGMIAGTPLYMAPEQAQGDTLDHRADLFSLGSVLYAIASGRPPFRAPSTLAVMKRVVEDTARPIREIIPEVPDWLEAIVTRLHAKDPAQRFQSAAEVAALLEQHLAHLKQPSLVPQPRAVEIPWQRQSSGRGTVLAAAGIALAILGVLFGYSLWRDDGPAPVIPESAGLNDGKGGDGKGQAQMAASTARDHPAAELAGNVKLQGSAAVRDALIDFGEPDRPFGATPQENAIRRADQCNAFLVRFDLAKLGIAPNTRVAKATVSFYVWDPSSSGKTKICAFPLKTAWDDATVTWRQPAAGQMWRGGESFVFEADAGPPGPAIVVAPEQDSDTADPPMEYQLDVTNLVRGWLDGVLDNYGLAIAPVIDPSVDEGTRSRFQIFGSEDIREQYTPKLTLQLNQD